MKSEFPSFVRFEHQESASWGVLSEDGTRVFRLDGDVYSAWNIGADLGPLTGLALLPPCEPKTISGLAYNYKDLVGKRDRYDEPLLFLKSVSTLVSAHDDIIVPQDAEVIWAEVEIALVLRTPLFRADSKEAEAAILGCLVANDITAANVQGRDHHLARSKSRHSFCPVSSILCPWHPGLDYNMRTTINGRETQNGRTSNRIYDDVESLVFISSIFPLAAGDLILTGSPAGATDSVFVPGDDVRLEIENVGSLNNKIVFQE